MKKSNFKDAGKIKKKLYLFIYFLAFLSLIYGMITNPIGIDIFLVIGVVLFFIANFINPNTNFFGK
ncbi:MAG: hypothetical protein ACOCRX_02170 [Candidatus Woesearchaeota archaeon]